MVWCWCHSLLLASAREHVREVLVAERQEIFLVMCSKMENSPDSCFEASVIYHEAWRL